MKLTTKSRYGTRAVLEIAKHQGEKAITRKSIGELQDISVHYLESILLELKNAGIVRTILGHKGGFKLRKDTKEISIYDIVSTFEGSLAPVECIDNDDYCSKSDNCPTRKVWSKLKNAQVEVLKSISIHDLTQENIDIDDLNIQ